MSIDAQGNVTFEGREHVRVIGRVTDRIPTARVREIFATIERIGFFKFLDHYREVRIAEGKTVYVTHMQTSFVTVTRNGESKRVEDYLGTPQELKDLARWIEDVTQSRRWIRIDVPTLRQLVADGHPPSPEQQDELLRRALYSDEVDVVRALLDIGADPGTRRSRNGAASSTPEITDVLLKSGVPADFHVDLDNTTALIRAAALGNVGVVTLLLAAGADPRRVARGHSALESARRARADAQRHKPLVSREVSGWQPRFVEDFDGVIAALEQALAKKR